MVFVQSFRQFAILL